MQSMTSYRRRRYIVEKHKIPTRRHKRTSNVKKFPLPCYTDVQSYCTSAPKWVVRFGNVLPQKNAPRKTKTFFRLRQGGLFSAGGCRRSPWQGGDAGVNRPCPPAKKSSSAACLRTFSLLYRLFTGLRAASAAAVHRQRYRRAVVGGIRVGRTARDRRGVLERRIRAGAQHTRKLQRDRLSRRQIADVDASRPRTPCAAALVIIAGIAQLGGHSVGKEHADGRGRPEVAHRERIGDKAGSAARDRGTRLCAEQGRLPAARAAPGVTIVTVLLLSSGSGVVLETTAVLVSSPPAVADTMPRSCKKTV